MAPVCLEEDRMPYLVFGGQKVLKALGELMVILRMWNLNLHKRIITSLMYNQCSRYI